MRDEHVKKWLSNIWCKEKVARENLGETSDTRELGTKWGIFVKMIQTI